jgi:hypothetical protein
MSSAIITINTGQQITTQYNLEKLFLWDNRYESDNYVNNFSYSTITLLAGTVMGRVASTGVLIPTTASAVDGSQYPIGVLARDVVNLAAGATQLCAICIAGDVSAPLLIFTFGDTLDTVVNGRRYRDRIQADSAGIILKGRTEMTAFDN